MEHSSFWRQFFPSFQLLNITRLLQSPIMTFSFFFFLFLIRLFHTIGLLARKLLGWFSSLISILSSPSRNGERESWEEIFCFPRSCCSNRRCPFRRGLFCNAKTFFIISLAFASTDRGQLDCMSFLSGNAAAPGRKKSQQSYSVVV